MCHCADFDLTNIITVPVKADTYLETSDFGAYVDFKTAKSTAKSVLIR